MVLTIATRAGVTVFVLLAVLILARIVNRAIRLTLHLDACADALAMNGGYADDRFIELVHALSPFGRIPRGLPSRPDMASSDAGGPDTGRRDTR
jgi:hypothetical protein